MHGRFVFIAAMLCSLVVFFSFHTAIAQSHLEPLFTPSASYDAVRIDRVINTDTIVLESGEKIRLIGLKALDIPKRKEVVVNAYNIPIREVNPVTTLEEKAFDFAKTLLEGKIVRIEFDAQKKGDDMRTLAYVFLPDKIFVNEEILRRGFAHLKTNPLNNKYVERLRAAYKEARREKRGLHGE